MIFVHDEGSNYVAFFDHLQWQKQEQIKKEPGGGSCRSAGALWLLKINKENTIPFGQWTMHYTCRFSRQVQEQKRIICLTWHSIASFHGIRMGGPSPFEQSYFPKNHREISSNLPHNISHTQPLKEWCLEGDPVLFWHRKSSVKWWDCRKTIISSIHPIWKKTMILMPVVSFLYHLFQVFQVQRVENHGKMTKATHHTITSWLWKYTPRKRTCPLKRDYFKRKYIFQPLIFRGHVSFPGVNLPSWQNFDAKKSMVVQESHRNWFFAF